MNALRKLGRGYMACARATSEPPGWLEKTLVILILLLFLRAWIVGAL